MTILSKGRFDSNIANSTRSGKKKRICLSVNTKEDQMINPTDITTQVIVFVFLLLMGIIFYFLLGSNYAHKDQRRFPIDNPFLFPESNRRSITEDYILQRTINMVNQSPRLAVQFREAMKMREALAETDRDEMSVQKIRNDMDALLYDMAENIFYDDFSLELCSKFSVFIIENGDSIERYINS
jgi:hypothetical protein